MNKEIFPFDLRLDYEVTLSALIKRGNYDKVIAGIKRFVFNPPCRGMTDVRFALGAFDREVDGLKALSTVVKQSVRPATIWELVFFGAHFPAVQNQFPIVALGSVAADFSDEQATPYLFHLYRRRFLGLYKMSLGFVPCCRFLMVVAEAPVSPVNDGKTGANFGEREFVIKTKTIESMAIAELVGRGRYAKIHPAVNDVTYPPCVFDGEPSRAERLTLFAIEKKMRGSAILRQMLSAGKRPVTLRELVAFGNFFPEAQHEYPIVALGSRHQTASGQWRVPCLYSFYGERSIGFDNPNSEFETFCRFLVVD